MYAPIMATTKPTSALLYFGGMQVFHNYFRPHQGLGGRTPAEAAGVKIESENPMIKAIQNAKKAESRESEASV